MLGGPCCRVNQRRPIREEAARGVRSAADATTHRLSDRWQRSREVVEDVASASDVVDRPLERGPFGRGKRVVRWGFSCSDLFDRLVCALYGNPIPAAEFCGAQAAPIQ